ncbi:MAG: glutamyl-tRNA reductase [Actinomycetota bacterium]|nr:glutamyl-tRNA reductase [Actinomycetota bacterium]
MSLLVVGLSHRSAAVRLLEAVAAGADDVPKVLHELLDGSALGEALVLSTCNRVEVYAEVEKFHAGVGEISDVLARRSGVPLQELSDSLYVHYEDRAVQHLFSVACGLDSMVVGEGQILGQLRSAYQQAQEEGATGRLLHELFQHGLRVGKRAHAETDIDRAGASLVGVGLQAAERFLGPLAGRPALLVGAGSMSALTGATLRRVGAGDIVVANRTAANAERLAGALGGRGVGLDGLESALTDADLVVCSTGSVGVVVAADVVERAVSRRGGRPLFFLDLALPHDVDPAVRELPAVAVSDLEALSAVLDEAGASGDVDAVRRIVAEEAGLFLAWQRAVRVAPTVVALRAKAADVVDGELLRLATRLPALDGAARAEVESTVRRVVDKLLHAPTVRIKELAEEPGGEGYAEALRELFGLDRSAPAAVTRASIAIEDEP